MFEQLAANFKGKRSLEVRERFDEYRLVFEGEGLSPQDTLAHSLELLTKARGLPSRDRFELQLTFQGDSISVTDGSQAGCDAALTHLQSHVDPGDVRIEFIVRKREERTLSIYSLSAFGSYLRNEKLATALAALSARFKGGIDLECWCPIHPSGSETIRFWPRGTVPASHDAVSTNRSQVLSTFRDNSYSSGFKGELIPSDFCLLQPTNERAIDGFMNKACAVLCASYLANSAHAATPELLSYKLIGYKAIEGEVAFSDLVSVRPHLYKIYEWAYGAGGSSDRIGLARNVISLHVNQLQDVKDDSGLWNAIHSNYQIYLKNNVASYLEVKGKLTEFLVESTAKTHALVEDLIDSLKNSMFVLLTFILTVVVVNGFKDTSATVVFSAPYVWIVAILCAVLTVWVAGTCFGLLRRFDNSTQTMASIMQLGYSKILLSSEISESVDPTNARNRQYLVKQCWRYATYWVLISAVLLVSFSLGNRYVGRVQSEVGLGHRVEMQNGVSSTVAKPPGTPAGGASQDGARPSKAPVVDKQSHSSRSPPSLLARPLSAK